MNMPRGFFVLNAVNAGALALLASMFGLACKPAIAQTTNDPFIGHWTVAWEGHRKLNEADLEITETGGHWQTYAWNGLDPCIGRRAPIERVRAEGSRQVLVVRFSQALQGCRDVKIVLRAAADGSLSGKRGESDLTLTRK